MTAEAPRVDRDGALAAMAAVRARHPGRYWIHHPEGGWDFAPPPPLDVLLRWARPRFNLEGEALVRLVRVVRERIDARHIEFILREEGSEAEKRNAAALAKAWAAVRCGRLA